MNLVIQTNDAVANVFELPEAAAILQQVQALPTAPPLVLGGATYHYFQISDEADMDWLITSLMDLPPVEAAFQKPDDALPGFLDGPPVI